MHCSHAAKPAGGNHIPVIKTPPAWKNSVADWSDYFRRSVIILEQQAIVKRGEIYYADLSPVVGSEQGGMRPVLIIPEKSLLRKVITILIPAAFRFVGRSLEILLKMIVFVS